MMIARPQSRARSAAQITADTADERLHYAIDLSLELIGQVDGYSAKQDLREAIAKLRSARSVIRRHMSKADRESTETN